MIYNFENTEGCEDKGLATQKKLGNSKLVGIAPTSLFPCPISLYSPSINYNVYPFESFTLPPLRKCLVVVILNLFTFMCFMEIYETINNNQEDSKHYVCFNFHPFNCKDIAYKSIQPETCFG